MLPETDPTLTFLSHYKMLDHYYNLSKCLSPCMLQHLPLCAEPCMSSHVLSCTLPHRHHCVHYIYMPMPMPIGHCNFLLVLVACAEPLESHCLPISIWIFNHLLYLSKYYYEIGNNSIYCIYLTKKNLLLGFINILHTLHKLHPQLNDKHFEKYLKK